MKFFVKLRETRDARHLESQIERWRTLGIEGVVVGDHLFTSSAANVREQRRHEPAVLLSAVGALARDLDLAVLVANMSLAHPVAWYRAFAELALLYGGDRVIAGMGAGWNTEEFGVLGGNAPDYPQRIANLREALRNVRDAFRGARLTVDAPLFGFEDFALSPSAPIAPRLAVGGGSPAIIDIAGEFADHLDFDAPAGQGRVHRNSSGEEQRIADLTRRMNANHESVLNLNDLLSEATVRHRRKTPMSKSLHISAVRLGDERGTEWLRDWQRSYAIGNFVDDLSLAQDSPFFLVGSASAVHDKLDFFRRDLSLSFLVVPDTPDLEALMEVAMS